MSTFRQRVNVRAVLVVAVVVLVGAIGALVLRSYQQRRVLGAALAQVRKFRDAGEPELALRHLNQYLSYRPEDVAALTIKSELLATSVRSVDQLFEAAKAHEQLLRLDPDGPGSRAARRRLCQIYIQLSDAYQGNERVQLRPGIAAFDTRYRAAESLARQLIKSGDNDAAVHRLLAMALEGVLVSGATEVLPETVREYQASLKLDPGDAASAERLARIYQDRLKDPARALGVLDALLKHRDTVVVRMIRHRYFAGLRRDTEAAAELAAAAKLAPDDRDVLLTAAGDALRRGDPRGARAELDKIPAQWRNDLRVLMVRGLVDLREEHPDEAVDDWRKGLMAVAGTDSELTWWLAYVLLQMGRTAEAEPLVAQYRRLVGDESRLYQLLLAFQDERSGRLATAIDRLVRTRDRVETRWQGSANLALGRCYEGLWDEPNALEAYRRAVQVDPKSTPPRLAIARMLLARRPEEAALELEQGLKNNPDDPDLLVSLAEVRLRQQTRRPAGARSWGEFDRAFARAAEKAPRNASLPLFQAERIATDGDAARSMKYLESAAKASPRSATLAIAWANMLERAGDAAGALQVLDRAAAPGAAGDKVTLRLARSRVLIAMGRGREARVLLARDLEKLPESDRLAIWVNLAQLLTSQGDRAGARALYEQWVRLKPTDTRPRLALLELDIAAGNEAAIRATVEALRKAGGPDDFAWRLAYASELLWRRSLPGTPPAKRAALLDQAGQLADDVLKVAPRFLSALLLRGQILDEQGRYDEAIASYQRAWDRGDESALPRLVDLLARRHRFDDLARLRQTDASARLDQLEAQALLRSGDKAQATRVVERMSRAQSDTLAWQAGMLELLGRAEDAEATLRAMAEQRPGDLDPWLVLLRFQASHDRTPAVAETLAKIKQSVKTDRPELLEARCLWAASDRPGADKAFDAALARHPEDREVQLIASRYFEETGRPARAGDCLRAVLDRNPGDRPVARQYAVVLSSQADVPGAWGHAWEVLGPESSAGPESPEDRLVRAIVLTRSADPARRESAIPLLEALVADLPAYSPMAILARESLVKLLMAAGRDDRASEVASVSATTVANPAAINTYAEALLRSRAFDAVQGQIERLEAISPDDPRAASLRARLILQRAANPVVAAEALEKDYLDHEKSTGSEVRGREDFLVMAGLGPDVSAVALRLGRRLAGHKPAYSWMPALILVRQGKLDEALADCQVASKSGSLDDIGERETARIALKVAASAEGKIEAAAAILDQSLARAPKDNEFLIMRAILHHMQGHYGEEVALYRLVLKQMPGSPVVLNNLAWALSEGMNQPSEALTLIDEALKQSAGKDTQALDTRGMILVRLKRYDDGIKDLQQAIRDKPIAIHYYHLAYAFHQSGRMDESRKAIAQAKGAGLDVAQLDLTEKAVLSTLMGP